jgi:hypothetical protein
VMMEAMKVKLSACGIGETSDVHNKDPISANQEALAEATSALAFLQASGVPYFARLKVVQVTSQTVPLGSPFFPSERVASRDTPPEHLTDSRARSLPLDRTHTRAASRARPRASRSRRLKETDRTSSA